MTLVSAAVVTFAKDRYLFNEDVFNGRVGLNVSGDLSKPFTVKIVSTDVTAIGEEKSCTCVLCV